ncbi:undecaprenyl/decaprenyl-phosphate alpha-N-acetylglucosaminyl 1-phosphate transferase [candidate division WWE3 bacterium]|nr:undecaprenyl/decaprenyl-phosphate alpha-N-acetylglucosaminyl 1-phosphate transferase [candidate division WWE3 bacterium]
MPARPHPAVLHSTPIPRAGGVAMYLSFLICALLFARFDALLIGILLGGGLNVFVGTLDDKYDISPYIRLGTQIVSAIIAIIAGVSIFTTNPFGQGIWYFDQIKLAFPYIAGGEIVIPADIILIFWIVWLMNTANWTKGVSQLPGVAVIAFLTITGVALTYQSGNPYQLQTALLSAISAGAVLAFVPFNFPPEKMFPGFGASTWIGFNLAVFSVLSGGKVIALLIVLAIPIIDALLVGCKRILTGHNPFIHDREHLYHFLLDSGFSKRQIIYFYWITAAIFGFAAVAFSRPVKYFTILLLTIIISVFFVFLYYKNKK